VAVTQKDQFQGEHNQFSAVIIYVSISCNTCAVNKVVYQINLKKFFLDIRIGRMWSVLWTVRSHILPPPSASK
jgi:hypothetical protein